MLQDLLSRIYDALFHPVIKLPADFPLSLSKGIKFYFWAVAIFFAGSFLPVLLINAYIYAGLHGHPQLCGIFTYMEINTMTMIVMISSFLLGFGAELLYIRHFLRKEGVSLFQAMRLNLDSLDGSWTDALRRASWAFLLAVGVGYLLDYLPLSPVIDPAAEFAGQLSGRLLIAFSLLVVFGAPFFEELVFRGFLFNMLRTTFRKGNQAATAVVIFSGITIISVASMQLTTPLYLLAAAVIVALSTDVAARYLQKLSSDTVADYSAIMLSAAIFAAFHLNLASLAFRLVRFLGMDVSWVDPTAFSLNLSIFPHIMIMGIFLAALYRRSGTLICPLLMHGISNLTRLIILYMSLP